MPFWNQNGIIEPISGFWSKNPSIPFGLQNDPNFKNFIRNGKYTISAFQNRAQNVSPTSRSIFRQFWSSVVRPQNRQKMTQNAIFGKIRKLQKIIKSDLGVEYTFPGRFWKAEGPYFSKIQFASTKSQIWCLFGTKTVSYEFCDLQIAKFIWYRFGSKKASNLRFCWCKLNFRKIWTFSFPKPSWECVFDP